ncbi:MAG: class I SAM-dependent methyltransferase, partial [Thermomicrobiales bacterium]
MHYLDLLRRLHEELRPAGYLEIGVDWGDSLALSRARSVAIDPAPKPRPESLLGKEGLILYAGTSDDFFREQRREAMLGGAPLDLAFIDGLHEFAQVVRDLEHVERWSHAGTVVAIHDVLPRNAWEAAPAFHGGAWTGTVWRVVPFLHAHRPDLRVWLTDATPTGMLIVTGLDPEHPGMTPLVAAQDEAFPAAGPPYDRLVEDYIATADVEPAETVLHALSLDRWLAREWEYITTDGVPRVADASWRPLLEAAADAHGTPQHERGLRACLRLIDAHWLPDGVREQAYAHLPHYASPLTNLWPGATCTTLHIPDVPRQEVSFPSPVNVSGELIATALTSAGEGAALAWRLLALDDTLHVRTVTPLRDETRQTNGAPPADPSIEQIHPYVHDARLQAIVTVCDRNPSGVAQAGLLSIADGAMCDLRLLSDPANRRHERDWAPLPAQAGLHVVSCWEPTETLQVDPRTGAVNRVALRPAPRLAERWQAASGGIAVPGGWLVLANERAEAPDLDAPLV